MWIVMTAAAHMPSSCNGAYRRVALVQLTDEYAAAGMKPKMISSRARGVVRVIDLGNHYVGKTLRCSYQRALLDAASRALELNRP